jgi:arylsulfatase A-like enzyme
MAQRMRGIDRLKPLASGLIVGLAWGLFAALPEGLPLLLQGAPWPHLGERLLALSYLGAIYGILCTIAGGLSGVILGLISRLTRSGIENRNSKVIGVFVAATLAILWAHRFDPKVPGWIVIALLAAGVGLAAAWLLGRAAFGGLLPWPVFRAAALSLFLVVWVAVLGVATFRKALRDRPIFNPPTTDQVATVEQPNIVLVTAGGVRADHLGVYGCDSEISPNIDALAARGTRFEQAFAPASWGEPSLASLLTSLYPSELGIDCRAAITCTPHLDAERTTLVEALQNTGYRTQAYLTDPWLTAELGFGQGFDGFESVRAEEPFDLGPLQGGTLGRLLGCRRQSAACRLMAQGHALLFDAAIPVGWGGDQVNARVGHFLDLHSNERFFLWVHYTEALPPYDLEPPFRPLQEGPLATPEKRLKRLGYWELGDPFTARETLLPLDVGSLQALYDAEVNRVDRLVGGLNGLLEAYGLVDRTLLVFVADHGQEFLEHGGYTYGHSLYDEVLRVPLIVAGPGTGSPGQVIAEPVSLLDVAPTLAQVTGASLPPGMEGRSLVSALRGEALDDVPIYAESLYRVPYELKALRADGYKLIYNVDDASLELYDLRTDAAEQLDISPGAGQVVTSMKSELLDWVAHTLQVAHDLPRAVPPTEFREAVW